MRLQNCRSEAEAWGSSKSLIIMLGISISAETHGGCPTMNAGTRQILQAAEQAKKRSIRMAIAGQISWREKVLRA